MLGDFGGRVKLLYIFWEHLRHVERAGGEQFSLQICFAQGLVLFGVTAISNSDDGTLHRFRDLAEPSGAYKLPYIIRTEPIGVVLALGCRKEEAFCVIRLAKGITDGVHPESVLCPFVPEGKLVGAAAVVRGSVAVDFLWFVDMSQASESDAGGVNGGWHQDGILTREERASVVVFAARNSVVSGQNAGDGSVQPNG